VCVCVHSLDICARACWYVCVCVCVCTPIRHICVFFGTCVRDVCVYPLVVDIFERVRSCDCVFTDLVCVCVHSIVPCIGLF